MKARLRYFVAASLDGFIARPDGDVSWLDLYNDAEAGEIYTAFISEISGIICGRATYDRGIELGEWWTDVPSMVITSRPLNIVGDHLMFDSDPDEGLARLRAETARGDIWLMGGGKLAAALIAKIDLIELHVVPAILGQGIPLFAPGAAACDLETHEARALASGLVRLVLTPVRGAG